MDDAGGTRFTIGRTIAVDHIFRDQLWERSPSVVVFDGTDECVLYRPAEAPYLKSSSRGIAGRAALTRQERVLTALSSGQWTLRPAKRRPTEQLTIVRPGEYFAVELHWEPSDRVFLGWYVNFQRPVRRTADGLSTMDLMLDLVAEPDGDSRWKDEHEYDEALRRGLISPEEGLGIARDRQVVLDRLAARDGAFSGQWTTWCPPDTHGWGKLSDIDIDIDAAGSPAPEPTPGHA